MSPRRSKHKRRLTRARAIFQVIVSDDGVEFVATKDCEMTHTRKPKPASPSGLHVVEWSFEQGCLHIQTLSECMQRNLCSFLENRPTGHLPVALCQSSTEASRLCDLLAAVHDRRDSKAPKLEGNTDEA